MKDIRSFDFCVGTIYRKDLSYAFLIDEKLKIVVRKFFDDAVQTSFGIRVARVFDYDVFFHRIIVVLQEAAQSLLQKPEAPATGQTKSNPSIFHLSSLFFRDNICH